MCPTGCRERQTDRAADEQAVASLASCPNQVAAAIRRIREEPADRTEMQEQRHGRLIGALIRWLRETLLERRDHEPWTRMP